MAKKDIEEGELDRELEDEDLEEEEEEEEDDEEDEDEDDDDLDDEDEDDDDLDDEDDEEEEDDDEDNDDPLAGADFDDEPLGQKDPFWWTPHVVLLLLLVVGMLGFFGLFNPWLGHLAPSHEGESHGSEQPQGHSSAAPTPSAPAGRPAPTQAATAPVPARTAAKRPDDAKIYGARHILVQFEGVRGQKKDVKRKRSEAQDRAEKVAAEAKKTKSIKNERERVKAFTALVDKYSDEPNAPRTRGDLGRFRDNAYEAKIVAGVKKLQVGDVSDPVESPFGFHVIWRTL